MEKITRELSQAEEANMKNRKRLRGIALAIQSVISLLYLVRSRNNINIDTGSSSPLAKPSTTTSTKAIGQKLKDDNSIISSPNISRIPRPTSAMASSPSHSRKPITATTAPIKKRNVVSAGATRRPPNYDQPDYSLKKGFLKREEKVDTGTLKKKKRVIRSKISVPTTPVRKPVASSAKPKEEPSLAVTAFKDKQVRFRPSSVIDVRVDIVDRERLERPGSAQGYRARKPLNLSVKNIPKNKENKTTIMAKDSLKDENNSMVNKIEENEKPPAKPKHENSADNIVGETSGVASNGVRLRKKTPRSRSNSMMDLNAPACRSTSKESVSSAPDTNNKTIINKEAETKRSSDQLSASSSRRNRPVSLLLGNVSSTKDTRKALTPSTDEFNRKQLKYRLTDQLHAVKKENSGRVSPKKNSKFKLSNLSSPRCRSPTRARVSSASTTKENLLEYKQVRSRPAGSMTPKAVNSRDRSLSATRRATPKKDSSPSPSSITIPSSPKKTSRDRSSSGTRSSLSSSRKSSTATPPKPVTPQGSPLIHPKSNQNTPTKGGGNWHPGTNILYKEPNSLRKPLSPKKKLNSSPKHVPRKSMDSGKVHITTEVNKRKNITFPNGKKVDRETNTKTTVSVDMNNRGRGDSEDTKAVKRASLLAKVKTLAQEIGSLSSLDTTPVSEGSSDSIQGGDDGATPVRSNSDMIESVIKEETDRFSETEYLSLSEKS